MDDHEEVLRKAAAWSDGGLGVAIATVVSTWGSAPRPAGSHLVVNERGELVGSVSGGCIEGAVVREALEAIRDGKPRLLEYGVTDERALEVGLACGGRLRVLVQPLPPDDVLAALLAAVAARRPCVLATELSSGEARLLDGEVPGAPGALAAAARDALVRDASGAAEADGRAWFLRAFAPRVRVVVVGAVHVAQALVPMARLAGFEPVIVDARPAFATAERFGDARVERGWPAEALARVGLDRRAAVAALTHDAKLDDPALAAALRSDAFYVGALGSRRTHAARLERLRALGLGDADLARIRAPIGLPIGAATPAEIAVAILAEIVAALRDPARAAPPR